jgi:hypothetical protein
MYKLILLALVLTGCASSGNEADDDESGFHRAAVSWVGAPVSDMVVRWGEPNNLKVEVSEDRDGLVRWRATNNTAADAPGAGAGAGTRYYTCIAEARYGMDGVITKVDTVSSNCEQLYTAEHLANLTR